MFFQWKTHENTKSRRPYNFYWIIPSSERRVQSHWGNGLPYGCAQAHMDTLQKPGICKGPGHVYCTRVGRAPSLCFFLLWGSESTVVSFPQSQGERVSTHHSGKETPPYLAPLPQTSEVWNTWDEYTATPVQGRHVWTQSLPPHYRSLGKIAGFPFLSSPL